MCLILRQPPGHRIYPELLRSAWENNHDGWGVVWRQARRPGSQELDLMARRGMSLDGLLDQLSQLPQGCEAFFHLRQATSGPVIGRLAHPFMLRRDVWMMHNGTIEAFKEMAASQEIPTSDSMLLAQHLASTVESLTRDQAVRLLRKVGFRGLMDQVCKGSFVLVIDDEGHVTYGRGWETIGPSDWAADQHGIQVSTRKTWCQRPCHEGAGAAVPPDPA